jgi:hypothetical protein
VGLGVKPPPQVHDPGGGVRSIALKYLSLGVPRHPVPRFWTPLAAPPPAGFAFLITTPRWLRDALFQLL